MNILTLLTKLFQTYLHAGSVRENSFSDFLFSLEKHFSSQIKVIEVRQPDLSLLSN
jgi:hypothetical protein